MSVQTERLSELQKRDPHLTFRIDPDLHTVRNLRGNLARLPATDAKAISHGGLQFLKDNEPLFGHVDLGRIDLLAEADDPNGGREVVLQQFHADVPVYGGSVRVHVRGDGTLDAISSSLFPDLEKVPKQPKINETHAVEIAQKAVDLKHKPDLPPSLLVYRHERKPHLAWKVQITDTRAGDRGRPAQWIVLIDAIDGAILVKYDNLQTAGPVVGNGTGYYSGVGPVNAWFNDSIYQLRDTSRTAAGGPEIITNDEDGASPSEDADDNWNALTLVPRDDNQGAEVDAHRYAGQTIDYYDVTHGRNSYDGAGGNVTILAHYGENFSNGFWDGAKVNLGDGSGVSPGDDYETSDDWLAHELTHGYTQNTCALMYLNEAGALNEAMSDIFAAFITGDWLVFEDTWLKPSAPAWRNMMDPTNGGLYDPANPSASVLAGHQPSHYTQRYTGAWDNGGVHVNSGIINNLFYLLTVGGTHTISGIAVTGIGQAAAEDMLFRCMTVNLVGQPTATFLDFREAMLDACLTLFPTDLEKLTQVKNAFNAVGIGPDIFVRDNLADTGVEPYPGSYLWASPDVINRTAPSAAPATDFADMANDALWQNVEFGQDNSIYVRLQNRGPETGDASVNVYFIPATSFATPAAWIHIGTLAEVGIAPGTVRISGPLTFPQAMIPEAGQHYCMLAVVSSSLDPAPDHTLIASVTDYIDFVRNTNNMAYRNMDVVDLVPGHAGHFDVDVHGFAREKFALRIDIDRLPFGMHLRVLAPAAAVRGAAVRGMKLKGRKEGQNVYELLAGPELRRHLDFVNAGRGADPAPGFDRLMVEKPFKLRVEYVLPKEQRFGVLAFPHHDGGEFAVRQLWNGQIVGAAGLRFRSPKKMRPEKTDQVIDKPGREKIHVKNRKR